MLFRTQSYLACSRQSVRSVYFCILKILIIFLFFNFNPWITLLKFMMVIKTRSSKIKSFWCQGNFSWILISKMNVKMNFRIITKNHAADSKIGSSLEIDLRADWTHESNLTAWELTLRAFKAKKSWVLI